MSLMPMEQAQARVLEMARPTAIEEIQVEQALGRYCAQDLFARRTQPAADLSAMDGYAVGGEQRDAWTLVGESRAGHPFPGTLGEGAAVRISTGALVPDGADRILIQENAERSGERLSCTCDYPRHGQHIRRRGFDFREGDLALPAGVRMNPAHIALALGAGYATVATHAPPSIAILDSGDELSRDPQNCAPHQIPASNGAMLASLFAQTGSRIVRVGPVADDQAALADALEKVDSDILVTTGGASVGDHDLIGPALERWGAQIDFWKVALKPGKPLMVARRGEQTIFGLPGNPVSAFVTAFLFVLPHIRACMGAADPLPRRVYLPLGQKVPATGPRKEFLRGFWDGHSVIASDTQDSGALQALARSNVLIEREPNSPSADAGATLAAFLLENGGIA